MDGTAITVKVGMVRLWAAQRLDEVTVSRAACQSLSLWDRIKLHLKCEYSPLDLLERDERDLRAVIAMCDASSYMDMKIGPRVFTLLRTPI